MIKILNLKTLYLTIILTFITGFKFLYIYELTKKTSDKLIAIQFLLLSSDFGFLSTCLLFLETDSQSFFIAFTLVKMAIEFLILFVVFILIEFKIFKEK